MKSGGLRLKNKIKQSQPGKPLVSIITVVFNGEKYLEQTIQSVLAQDYENIEYLVIDGGSEDRTLEIITKYEDQLDFWISEKDKGITNAFNKGISYAQGELVGIMNADDWYEPDCISQVISRYAPDKIFHGNMKMWMDDQAFEIAIPDHSLLLKEMTVNHPTVFVCRSLYKRFGSFDESYRLSMDYEFLLRMAINKVEMVYLNSVLANMRMGGASSNWRMCYQETKKAKDRHLGRSISNSLFYNWQVIRRKMSIFLDNQGLSFILNFYRKNLSVIKREKYDKS